MDQSIRYPVMGGFLQQRGGTARHDAVAWGYARAADDIRSILSELRSYRSETLWQKITGIQTTKGLIKTRKVGCVVAGHSSLIADMAGIHLPITIRPLQALVSEPIKPVLDTVIMSNAVHMYIQPV